MAALVGLFLTAFAIALAWLLYRLERLHARHRDLDAALAVLRGVNRGLVEGVGSDPGWTQEYFTTIYTSAPDDPQVQERADDAYTAVMKGRAAQIFPVTLAPLELLVASSATSGLVSDETVFIANVALWRMRIFDQFADMQADFNVRFAPEIRDDNLPSDRREAIAEGAAWIARGLHVFGIGEANVEGGWYARLKRALDADIARLTDLRAQGFFDYGEWRRWLLIGDLGMLTLVVAVVVTLAILAIGELS